MLGLIPIISFVFFMFFMIKMASRKICPPNTVIIIDRDTHYYKTIRTGSYSKGYSLQKNDVITTIISTNKETTVQYSNVFMTHDARYYMIRYHVSYSCEDLDAVISSLQDSRRSIYDIINHAVSIAIKSLTSSDFSRYSTTQVKSTIFSQIESMLEPFYIDFKSLTIDSITYVNEQQGEMLLFRKHESQGESPIK